MVKIRSKTGREATRKHAQETREIALILFHHTPITREECARLLRVKEGAIKGWWEAEGKERRPAHRKGRGSPPRDPADELRVENQRLTEMVRDLEMKLAQAMGILDLQKKGGTEHLMREAKTAMATLIHSPATKLGELASTVRALAEIEEIERLKDLAKTVRVVVYRPDDAMVLEPADWLLSPEARRAKYGAQEHHESDPDHH